MCCFDELKVNTIKSITKSISEEQKIGKKIPNFIEWQIKISKSSKQTAIQFANWQRFGTKDAKTSEIQKNPI